MKNGLLYRKHQETKTGRSSNQDYAWMLLGSAVLCNVCLRTMKKGNVKKVTLGSMPLIAVDIVGLIAPPSEAGHRYILTLVDYATRYPRGSFT